MDYVFSLFSSFFISLLGVRGFRSIANRWKIGSLPTARSMHRQFIPLLGGLGFFLGIAFPLVAAHWLNLVQAEWFSRSQYFLLGWIVIVLTGLFDDISGLKSWQKFFGELVAASFLVLGGCVIEAFISPSGSVLQLGWGSIPFTILWIIFIINSMNLLDGLDGLAAGIGFFAFLGFFFISVIQGNSALALLALIICGAIAGFLRYNWHPASIFMGDSGSLQLGYLLAFFSIETLRVAGSHQVYFLASLVILGLPVTDTLISFLRRLGRGESPFKPDTEHLHHRLIKLGLSHRNTVLLLYTIAAFFMVLGILMTLYSEITGYILFGIAFVTSIYWTRRLGYLEAFQRYPSIDWISEDQVYTPPLHLNRLGHQLLLFIVDVFTINITLFILYWVKFQSGWLPRITVMALHDYLADPVFLFITISWLTLFWLNGLYNMPWDIGRFDKVMRVSKVITFGVLVLGLITMDLRSPIRSSQLTVLTFYWVTMLVFVNGGRLAIIQLEKKWKILEYSLKPTLLIGTGRQARSLIKDVQRNPHLLYNIRGIVVKKPVSTRSFMNIPILGTYEDIPRLIQEHQIEEIIVVIPEKSRADLLNIVGICDRFHVVMKTTPSLRQVLTGSSELGSQSRLIRIFPETMVPWQWIVKRFVDVTFAMINLIFLAPVWLGIGVGVALHTKNWPLLRLPAVGKFGQPFHLWVFRIGTKVPYRYYYGLTNVNSNTSNALSFSFSRDVNPWGKFLFYSRLYKMPQIINILKGEMSIVGPRPEPPQWYRQHQDKITYLYRRLFVRPGITGYAQIKFRYETGLKQVRNRVTADIDYIENLSLRLDFQIILRSIWLFFRLPTFGRG